MARHPILHDLPERIETERLVLRCPREGDGRLVHEAIQESFSELHGVMYWARSPSTVTECEVNARLARSRYVARRDMRLLVFRSEDGRLLGSSGLHRPDWTVPKFEIGYWLRTSETGKGYATEAVGGVARFAFETLSARRVEIRCDARNERSAAVARRLGFELEGTLRRDRLAPDGSVSDTLVFARVDAEGLPT
jgi:RimJ/RimL family protein N-acetyltransferase